nr:hypothetical protein [Pyrinomonadaceae bacterium]
HKRTLEMIAFLSDLVAHYGAEPLLVILVRISGQREQHFRSYREQGF